MAGWEQRISLERMESDEDESNRPASHARSSYQNPACSAVASPAYPVLKQLLRTRLLRKQPQRKLRSSFWACQMHAQELVLCRTAARPNSHDTEPSNHSLTSRVVYTVPGTQDTLFSTVWGTGRRSADVGCGECGIVSTLLRSSMAVRKPLNGEILMYQGA